MKTTKTKDFSKHPCFNEDAKGKYGRVHLPVAPKCNIKCNFCDRKYDCVNESRPGVTSNVLTPAQAAVYMEKVLEKEKRISVAGIAGPGDPFANGAETMATLKLIDREYPETLLCVSSNGMNIGEYIDDLAEMNVSHITITVCAVDAKIGSKIYSWVRDGKVIYRGIKGAELLLERQLDAIKRLKEKDICVKVNCIVIPGINEHHIEDVAIKMKELGVDLFNCMAMFPNVNTPFANIEQPGKEQMEEIRKTCEQHLPQMRHCTRCRADAVGLLGEDKTEEFRSCLSESSMIQPEPAAKRKRYAIASREGALVNLHLGEAKTFHIWKKEEDSFVFEETRKAPPPGGGIKRWHQLAKLLGDCRAILSSGAGETPSEILSKSGIMVVEAAGLIDDALEMVASGPPSVSLKGRRSPCKTGTCSGSGGGCL